MTDDARKDARGRWEGAWSALALAALCLAAHWPALDGEFIWDDHLLITQNPLIAAPDGLRRFWLTTEAPDYFPLTSTTWWVEWRLWGSNPLGYHAVNLLLHAGSAVLLWLILRELSVPWAWLGAALWAVHPVNVESVAWIAERKNTLSTFLAAVAMLLFLRFDRTRRAGLYAAALLAFTAALLAKTSVVPLPLVMLGCAWWRRGRPGGSWRSAAEVAPFAVMAAGLAALTVFFQYHRSIMGDVVRTDGPASRVAIAGRAVWFYLGKLAWPADLAFVYPRWPTGALSALDFVPLGLLAAVIALLWGCRKRLGVAPVAALAYFVVMLLPVLGLLNIYFMRYSLVSDHWQYAASAGPLALAAAAGEWLAAVGTRFRPVVKAGACVVLGVLVILAERQSGLYGRAETLWRDTVAKNPTSWMAELNLGHVLMDHGRFAEAQACYAAARDLDRQEAEPWWNLGVAEAKQGRYRDAMTAYRRAIALSPKLAPAYYNLASACAAVGDWDGAVANDRKAVEYRPDLAAAHYGLAVALDKTGKHEEAVREYREAARLNPPGASR